MGHGVAKRVKKVKVLQGEERSRVDKGVCCKHGTRYGLLRNKKGKGRVKTLSEMEVWKGN